MGTILRGKCPGCGYETELLVGGGLRDWDPEAALAAAGRPQALASALEEGCRFQIERVPATCATCKAIRTGGKVTWWTADGTAHHASERCPGCGGVMLHYPAAAREVLCPTCGQKVPLTPSGHWD